MAMLRIFGFECDHINRMPLHLPQKKSQSKLNATVCLDRRRRVESAARRTGA